MPVSKPYIPEAYIRETSRMQADSERDKLLRDVAKKSARRAELYREKHRATWWEKKTPEVPGEK